MIYPQPGTADGKVRFSWIAESWRLYTAEAGTWSSAITIAGLVPLFVGGLVAYVTGLGRLIAPAIQAAMAGQPMPDIEHMPAWWLTSIITDIVAAYFFAGLQRMANMQLRGARLHMAMVFEAADIFPSYAGYTLLCGIPGDIDGLVHTGWFGDALFQIVIWTVTILTAIGYPMIADGDGAISSLRRSVATIGRRFPMAAAFYLTFTAIVLLSALPCFIGLIVTTPMITILASVAYRDMVGMPDIPVPPQPRPYSPLPPTWPPPPNA